MTSDQVQPLSMNNQTLSGIQAFQAQLSALAIPRTNYTVEEVARIAGKASYTVREWCRLGQINAFKSGRCGASCVWRISTDELKRYMDEGLLPIDPERNTANRHKTANRKAVAK